MAASTSARSTPIRTLVMNALKPLAAEHPTPTAVAQREPTLSLLVQTSLGELVPVSAPPIPVADYQHAADLATTAGRSASRLKTTVGPQATAQGFDAWLAGRYGAPVAARVASGVLGGLSTIAGGCLYGFDGVIAGAYAAAGGAVALAFFGWAAFAEVRAERALTKARGQRVESPEVDKLLKAFTQATPEVRAIAADAVRAELACIDATLSAKAAEERDRALSAKPASPESERASRLAVALAALLREDAYHGQLRYTVDAITKCLTEASPAERRAMAAAIERCAFDKEQPRFNVGDRLHEERRLYRAIRAAENGEAPAL